jgi:ATP-binding cassette subfamily F protein 3
MLRLDHISKVYPTGEVLKDINWEVKAEEKVGLVGVNGAGKSTQLKIITGAIEPTSGNIVRPASLHLGYLDQEFDVEPTYTVREELWTVFAEAGEAQKALHLLHQEMEQAQGDELDGLITKLDRLQRRFESLDGYSLETKIDKILPEMGFEPQDGDRLVSSFSGGWQMRICLAKILLKKEFARLDESRFNL